ncbi:MAG: hypothetical protein M5U28_18040 [Sandaracinaceae bacterium]|nr:hypothetical protein [Sandaracinaceae bacterium]
MRAPRVLSSGALLLLLACDAPPGIDGGPSGGDAGRRDASVRDAAVPDGGRVDASRSDAGGGTLAAEHPGDVGLGDHPDVVWFEDFEEGSLAAIAARYDQVRDNGRFSLVTDTPNGSGSALAMRAGQGQDAVDLYKQLPDGDEWYVRWYARYEAGVPWHHSGMWFGGYAPAMPWPSPNAGRRPDGDDRFSISIEPVYDGPAGEALRLLQLLDAHALVDGRPGLG